MSSNGTLLTINDGVDSTRSNSAMESAKSVPPVPSHLELVNNDAAAHTQIVSFTLTPTRMVPAMAAARDKPLTSTAIWNAARANDLYQLVLVWERRPFTNHMKSQ